MANFDVEGALQAGYSREDILRYMSSGSEPAAPQPAAEPRSWATTIDAAIDNRLNPAAGGRTPEIDALFQGGIPAETLRSRAQQAPVVQQEPAPAPFRPDFRTGALGAINPEVGAETVAEGWKQMWEPRDTTAADPRWWDKKAGGASQVIRGAMQLGAPAMLPALAAAPIPTLAGLAAGIGASEGTSAAAEYAGVPPGQAALMSDIAGLVGGGMVGHAPPDVDAIARGAGEFWADTEGSSPRSPKRDRPAEEAPGLDREAQLRAKVDEARARLAEPGAAPQETAPEPGLDREAWLRAKVDEASARLGEGGPSAEDEFHRAEEGRRGEKERATGSRVYGQEREVLATSLERDLPYLDPATKKAAIDAAIEGIRARKNEYPATEAFPFQPIRVKDVKWKFPADPSLARLSEHAGFESDSPFALDPEAMRPAPKATIEYQQIPYSFDAPVRGNELWSRDQLTPAGSKVADRLANKMVEEVKALIEQAEAAGEKEPGQRTLDERTALRVGGQKAWYTRMRTILRRAYGSAGDMLGDLLGATSAQTPVDTNWAQGTEALEKSTKGEYDTIAQNYRTYREGGGQPRKYTGELALREGGKKYNANTMQVMDALIGMWRGKESAPKTQNYSGNLTGRIDLATIDVWAARALQRIRHLVYGDAPPVPPAAEGAVSGSVITTPSWITREGRNTGQFMFGQKVFDRAAAQLGMSPHELQAFMWFVEKDHWTRHGMRVKEGGDMAAIARGEGLGRMVAGIEPQDSSVPANAVDMMRRAHQVAAADPAVRSVVNTHALGMWSAPGGDNAGKPVHSSNFEVTLPENNEASINRISAEIVRAAQKHNQDDAFIARTIPDESTSSVYARPGLSVYFKRPLSDAQAWKVINQVKTENIGGFTLFGGPGAKPGQYLGMRFIYMPEYVEFPKPGGGFYEPAEIARMSDAEVGRLVEAGKAAARSDMHNLLPKLEKDGLVGHAMVEHYDVLNATKEDYGRLIKQLQDADAAGREAGLAEATGGRGPWRRDVGQSVKRRAVARSRGPASP